MNYLAVTKFEQYQHYTQRRPPWVKFYVKLLEPDNPLMRLPVSTRYVFHMLLLLAAECENAIPNDFEWLVNRLRMPPEACREGLDDLLRGRWIKEKQTKRRASKPASKPASDVLAPEAEGRRQKKDLRAVVQTSEVDAPLERELKTTLAVTKLINAIGDVDEDGLAKIRGFALRLPEGSLAKVAESIEYQRPRNRVGYAIAALGSELRERQ